MTILTNVEDERIIVKILTNKKGVLAEKDVGIIDVDYSLIRFLGKQLAFVDVILNNSGYPIITKANATTTLYRFILEYYSQYDERLKQILEHKKYEINHKNKDKLDNRLDNLEIVTHQNNIRHSKNLEYESIMTSQQLLKIQQKSLKDKQQAIDKAYLNRISGLFYKAMNNDVVNEKLLKCPYYYSFKYVSNTIACSQASLKVSAGVPTYQPTPKILTIFHQASIQSLLLYHKQFIFRNIAKRNLTLIKRNINRYPYIKKTLSKYKVMDEDNPSSNILIDFYKKVYEKNRYTIAPNGDILLTISIKSSFRTVGKHKAFLVLYYLQILQRKSELPKVTAPALNDNKYMHTPTFIKIVPLADGLFKEINQKCKELLELNYNSIRYFQIREQFGEETANLIYNSNKRLKSHYQYSLKAKEDIISILKKDKAVILEGFITKDKIVHEVKLLNYQRKQNGEFYSKIYNSFSRFISSLLLYNKEITKILEQLDLIYIRLNTTIIHNIQQHQKQNGVSNTADTLKPNMKVIVLKKLT